MHVYAKITFPKIRWENVDFQRYRYITNNLSPKRKQTWWILCTVYANFEADICFKQLFISPSSELLSSSLPSSLFRTLLGKASCISCHRSWLTSLLFLDAFLLQVANLILHIGQVRLVSCTLCLKHCMQSSCRQGIVTGSIKIYIQIGQIQSDSFILPFFSEDLASPSSPSPFKSDAILVWFKIDNCATQCARCEACKTEKWQFSSNIFSSIDGTFVFPL